MIDTMEPTLTAAAQMVAAANSQLDELASHIQELDRRMSEAQGELIAIADAREDRAHRLSIARSEAEQLSGEHDQATAYAKLAHRTPNQQRATKAASDAKKALQSAQGKLSKMEAETAEAEHVAGVRELELNKQVHLLQVEKETREAEQEAVMRGRRQAHVELGEEKRAAILARYNDLAARVDAVHTQLVDAQCLLLDYHESALSELKDWPDLQREVRNLHPPDDALLRVLYATQMHVEVLHQDIANVPLGTVALPWDLRDVLFIREGTVYHRGQLEEHQHRLQQVIDAYHEHLQQAERR